MQIFGVNMKKGIILFIALITLSANASEWKPLPGYDIFELYSGSMAKKLDVERTKSVVGTSGLSWPDGRQAIVIHIEVEQGKEKWLYRCIQYFAADMQQTGEQCYELRE
jgi:hypothetical protein